MSNKGVKARPLEIETTCNRCGHAFSSPLVHFDWEGKRYCEHCSCEIIKNGGCLGEMNKVAWDSRDNEIHEMDIVSVHFNNSQHTLIRRGRVYHRPCATGDSWQIKDLDTLAVHYISEGCTVIKKKEDNVEQ